MQIFKKASGKIIRTIHGQHLQGIDWPNLRILTYNGPELSLFSLEDNQIAISLTIIDSINWVVTHPTGLFDASPGAMQKLYFTQNLKIIELEKLKDKYYEPDLWEKVMSGKPVRQLKTDP